jgi:Glutamine amidotransferase
LLLIFSKVVAKDNVKIEVTSNLNKIKLSDKVVLPGQGSFKTCVDALNNIEGLVDTLNELAINNKKTSSWNLCWITNVCRYWI